MELYPPGDSYQTTTNYNLPSVSVTETTTTGFGDFHYADTNFSLNNISSWAPVQHTSDDYYGMEYIDGLIGVQDSGILQSGNVHVTANNVEHLQINFPACSDSSSFTSSNGQIIQDLTSRPESQEPVMELEQVLTRNSVKSGRKSKVSCSPPSLLPIDPCRRRLKSKRVGYHRLYDLVPVTRAAKSFLYKCLVVKCNHEAVSSHNIWKHIIQKHMKYGIAASEDDTAVYKVYQDETTGKFKHGCGFKWCNRKFNSSKCVYEHILEKHLDRVHTCTTPGCHQRSLYFHAHKRHLNKCRQQRKALVKNLKN